MKRSRKILLGAGIALAALGVAGYFHFHDDPPPDLSRFPEPVYDVEAYAESKKLADAFLAKRVEYQPKEPGDIDENTIEDENDCIVPRALRGDPVALRCLRREIAENKEAIPLAEKLLSLPKVSDKPPVADKPGEIDSAMLIQSSRASRLLERAAILAQCEGNADESWKIVEYMVTGSRARHRAATTLIDYLTASAIDNRIARLIAKLVKNDSLEPRLRHALGLLNLAKQTPEDLRRALTGEWHFGVRYAPVIVSQAREKHLPRIAQNLDQTLSGSASSAPKLTTWNQWFVSRTNDIRREWDILNFLPNATLRAYADEIDRRLADPDYRTPPASTGEWLRRNSGGRLVVRCIASSFDLVTKSSKQIHATHDLARIAVGVRLYQLSHDGKNPATLADLAPGILPAIPADPFDGKPLRYDAKTGRAWSVGDDRNDDGGDPEKDVTL